MFYCFSHTQVLVSYWWTKQQKECPTPHPPVHGHSLIPPIVTLTVLCFTASATCKFWLSTDEPNSKKNTPRHPPPKWTKFDSSNCKQSDDSHFTYQTFTCPAQTRKELPAPVQYSLWTGSLVWYRMKRIRKTESTKERSVFSQIVPGSLHTSIIFPMLH